MVRDYSSIARALMGEWNKTSQPLKERASVLPLGQYEDGSVGLAWPGLLAAPAEGVINFGSVRAMGRKLSRITLAWRLMLPAGR
jgi:hypothetical protein